LLVKPIEVQYRITAVFGQRIHMNVMNCLQTVIQLDHFHLLQCPVVLIYSNVLVNS
jgi:hypothetical protein